MQITTFRMIYLTVANEYDPWPRATTFRTFQLPELIADTLTAGLVLVTFQKIYRICHNPLAYSHIIPHKDHKIHTIPHKFNTNPTESYRILQNHIEYWRINAKRAM